MVTEVTPFGSTMKKTFFIEEAFEVANRKNSMQANQSSVQKSFLTNFMPSNSNLL